ncbi:hypothetical protein M0804_009284 [Polistes exclamans]|nr:hypothetical protein M0804_009284 [Polistes exclamans]
MVWNEISVRPFIRRYRRSGELDLFYVLVREIRCHLRKSGGGSGGGDGGDEERKGRVRCGRFLPYLIPLISPQPPDLFLI